MPDNYSKALADINKIPNSGVRKQLQKKIVPEKPTTAQFGQAYRDIQAIPNFPGSDELRSKATSQLLEMQQFQRALSPFGLDPEQLTKLIEVLNQNLGASKELNTATRRQATAGQPKAVQQAASQSGENQLIGALTRAISQVQAQGIDQQQSLIAGILQRELQRQQIAQQNQQSLTQVLGQLGIEIGSTLAGGPQNG